MVQRYLQTTRLGDPVFFDTPVLIKERVPSLGLHFPPIFLQPYINTSTSAPTEYCMHVYNSPTFSRGGGAGKLNRTPNTCICTTNCHDLRPHELTLIQVYNSTDFPQLSETRYRQPQARTPRHNSRCPDQGNHGLRRRSQQRTAPPPHHPSSLNRLPQTPAAISTMLAIERRNALSSAPPPWQQPKDT